MKKQDDPKSLNPVVEAWRHRSAKTKSSSSKWFAAISAGSRFHMWTCADRGSDTIQVMGSNWQDNY